MITLFNLIQEVLSGYLNAYVLIFAWALGLSIFSMLVYRLSSPQKKLVQLKDELNTIKEQMQDEELMDEQSLTIAGKLLATSTKKMCLTFLPALLSGIPIVLMWGFLSYHFDRHTPQPGEEIAMSISPQVAGLYFNKKFIPANEEGLLSLKWPKDQDLQLDDPNGDRIFSINYGKPEYYLNKWQWWNMLIRSPYGYIDDDATVSEISLQLPMREYLPFGPWWLRSWCALFVTGMVAFSLSIKSIFKIE